MERVARRSRRKRERDSNFCGDTPRSPTRYWCTVGELPGCVVNDVVHAMVDAEDPGELPESSGTDIVYESEEMDASRLGC